MSKTALDLPPAEWHRYQPAKHAQAQLTEHEAQIATRKQQAWQVARQAAQLLRQEFQAQRVILFGSLASESGFTPWSDIDLAAWGIPADRFFAAVAAVTGLTPEFKVDLIDPDTCRPGLKAAIERDGLDL